MSTTSACAARRRRRRQPRLPEPRRASLVTSQLPNANRSPIPHVTSGRGTGPETRGKPQVARESPPVETSCRQSRLPDTKGRTGSGPRATPRPFTSLALPLKPSVVPLVARVAPSRPLRWPTVSLQLRCGERRRSNNCFSLRRESHRVMASTRVPSSLKTTAFVAASCGAAFRHRGAASLPLRRSPRAPRR